jgi:L-alanine-DL-glutamate epimerase-like enolase superfamily enzyme
MDMTKIVELTALHVKIPLRRPIRHASHRREDTDNVVVRCRLEGGTVGHGEGVPRDYVTGETIDSALGLLARSDLGAQLTACADFTAAVHLADRLRLAPVPGDDRGIQGNAARCAVELAVLDAYGRRFGVPLSQITAMVAPDCHAPRPWVRYSGAITSARGLKLRVTGWIQRIYGFHQVKVKVGIPGYDDARRLHIIRRTAGRKMDLRIDANEAWSPDEAPQRIGELLPVGITSVEQPLAHEHLGHMAKLRRQVKVPIMLDESLCGIIDAERVVAEEACDLFNVRLSKCGGVLPSLRLVQFARRHGLGCQLGCQVGETAILSAAGRHFAASVADLRYLEGSYDRHLVREALGRSDITFGRGGKAPALAGGGLGVEIDPAALERVTVRSVRVI